MSPSLFFLAAATDRPWPDTVDWPVLAAFTALAFGLPALGYTAMVLDFRAYLRSLRRALVLATRYRRDLPDWVRRSTPPCILALDLTMPCSAEDVLAAYRRKVKQLHPDRGGDRRAFLRLQSHFEEACSLVESMRNTEH
jgi:hypothetical protein